MLNSGWGYDRIVGALANLGHPLSDQTVGNILRRHDIAPAPKRSQTTTWKDLIRRHMDVAAGTNFFTVEVLTWRGLVTYYVLFFIQLETRRVTLAGITRHPEACWMRQVARNATLEDTGYLKRCRYVLHDRDKKFCAEFRDTLAAGGVNCVALPARSPNLKGTAERWVGSCRREILDHVVALDERQLLRLVRDYVSYYHLDRNHDSLDKDTPDRRPAEPKPANEAVISMPRLGGPHHRYAWCKTA